MLKLVFLIGLATANAATNLDWNPIATRLLSARSDAYPATTYQQTPVATYQQVPSTYVAASQPNYLAAVPLSRDLSSGISPSTGTYYQSAPSYQSYQSVPVQTYQTQSIPTQTLQARNFSGTSFSSGIVQTPSFTQTVSQPAVSISQTPVLTQTVPLARQATFTTDTFPAKKTLPVEFSARSISTNPDNVKVLGRNSTITLIHQDDDTSLLLINSTNHAHHHHDSWKNVSLVDKVPLEVDTINVPVKNTTTKWIDTDKKIFRSPIVNTSLTQDTVAVVAPVKTQSVITSAWKDATINTKPTADWTVIPASSGEKVYVFDFLAPPVTSAQLLKLVEDAVPGQAYPALTTVPLTSFTCAGKIAGYYADVETGCQAFHRCDTEGKQSDYLCPEKTIYNQVTLTCDWFFNVDCPNSRKFEQYANSRLYTDLPLFDTPPKDYVPRWVGLYYNQLQNEQKANDAQVRVLKY